MKKISYYIALIVAGGVFIISFWIYQKYFKPAGAAYVLAAVQRGDIQEVVKVRGEIAAKKEFNLGFPFPGIVKKIYVSEGNNVQKDAPLIKLDTADFELDVQRLQAIEDQSRANLDKLTSGATPQNIQVSETKVANAQTALLAEKKNVIAVLQDSYAKSDDAVRTKSDVFFTNSQSTPQITFQVSNLQLKIDLESLRAQTESTLNNWQTALNVISSDSDFDSYIASGKQNLNLVKSFLEKANSALANAIGPTAILQTSSLLPSSLSTWQSNVSAARINVNSAIVNLATAEEKFRDAQSNLVLAQNELALVKAGTREEELDIAKAQVKEVESQIAIDEDKISKSTLRAPVAGSVVKIYLEEGEVFNPGQTAVTIYSLGYKIQADVSELDIGKIKENGDNVSIQFDAFPNQTFKGRLVSIEPQEIVKEGDKYYRINVFMDKSSVQIRSGMSADLVVFISSKQNVLKIPELAVYQKGGSTFVRILENGNIKEVQIETGISDGENIEIIRGLNEGQAIVVSSGGE